MKNKGIIIFLIVLAAVIVVVMIGDWFSKRPDKMEANKFEFSLDEFKNVPDELIHYKEIKNYKVGFEKPAGLTIENDRIFVVGDQKLKIIDLSGKLLQELDLPNQPRTVEVVGDSVYIAFQKQISIYNAELELENEWELDEDNSLITAIAVNGNDIYVADAGIRKIHRYSASGQKLGDFEGKASEDVLHGFIIPSGFFDLDINPYGDLWVVNPGLHSLENYTPTGRLREHWKASGNQTENLSGCCNPAHFCFLPDGSFLTSEKGLVRVKVYKPSGEFLCVVAPPTKFEDKIEGQAPDVAVDNVGNIYALDFDRNVLRVFEKK